MHNIVKKKVLCSAEKCSVVWAIPNSRSSAEQFGRTERSVGHYCGGYAAAAMQWDFFQGLVLRFIQ